MHLDIEALENKGVLKYVYDATSIPMVFNGLLPDSSFLDASFSEEVHDLFSLLNTIKYNKFNLSYLGPFRSELSRTFTTKLLKIIPSDIKDNLRHMFFMIKRINQMGSLEIK